MIATQPDQKLDYQEALVKNVLEGTQLSSAHRIRSKTIALATGLREPVVRECIHSMRLKGYLIGSDHHGFYVPYNGIEAEATVRHLWSRVREIAKVARAMTASMKVLTGHDITEAEQQAIVFGDVDPMQVYEDGEA
jgi:translation initiation factor 6 (eIF-6)